MLDIIFKDILYIWYRCELTFINGAITFSTSIYDYPQTYKFLFDVHFSWSKIKKTPSFKGNMDKSQFYDENFFKFLLFSLGITNIFVGVTIISILLYIVQHGEN